MDREQKKIAVKSLKKYFEESEGIVVTHYLGLNSSELTEFRQKVSKVGSKFFVTKNSLVKLASKETPYEALENYFKGPTAIVFSKDPVAGIKVVKKYTEENEKLKVVKASLNEKIIDEEEFNTLSKLSSLEDLRSEIASYLLAPHQNLVQILNAASTELVGVLNNYSKK
ncbi:MAG: 50S ribosomal protein L10 [Alphaproteobacteria bacterium MarineAlpha9_Bin4]|nr:MAG: 50S ribosomal protein L10 [Alphaproteobacteria bacterium MarineAlpha9_Bin4]|tara:strand:- start:1332 stop:1838 length:507 start_codon:yes stop_codon:yes gene_type:complete